MQTLWWEWDGQDTVVMIANSLGLATFCRMETETVGGEYTLIFQPNELVKYHGNGNFFAHVFEPSDNIAVFGDCPWWEGDFSCICSYWENGPMVAEGIIHSADNDNGKNSFGYSFSGTLYDLTGSCTSGMVDLNTVRRFRIDNKSGWTAQVMKGPRLDCVE